MKKLFLMAAFVVLGLTNVNAQETSFGLKAGIDAANSVVKIGSFSVSGSDTGFYIGGFAEIGVSDTFTFQPEVMYVGVTGFNMIQVPLMAKFGVSEQFNVLVGPSLGLLLDSVPGQKSFNFGVEAGAAYDISDEFFVEARYNLGLANLIENAPSGSSIKLNGLFAGLGYRF